MASARTIWNERYSDSRHFEYEISWIYPYLSLFKEMGYQSVLELGCGDGKCSKAIFRKGFKVVATDISNVAIDCLAQNCKGLNVARVDMSRKLPFKDRSFDVVLANLSSHYFSSKKTSEIYADVYRVLNNDGMFVLRVNDKREYRYNKEQDTVKSLGNNFVLSVNGKTKHYFDADDLDSCLSCFSSVYLHEVSFWCNGHTKYALEAFARKQ